MMSHEMSLYNRYWFEIRDFFKGVDYWKNRDKGHIWLCNHPSKIRDFYTLIVEPLEGGQYELAVRWKGDDGKWQGYKVRDDLGDHTCMSGYNTGGH